MREANCKVSFDEGEQECDTASPAMTNRCCSRKRSEPLSRWSQSKLKIGRFDLLSSTENLEDRHSSDDRKMLHKEP